MPTRQTPKTVDEDDEVDAEEADDEDDEVLDELDEDDEELEAEGEDDEEQASRPRRSARARTRGVSGMGRPSTGPAVRRSPSRTVDAVSAESQASAPETELVGDISDWPRTSEAAKMVGRHSSTIKLWRTQGRIRAERDGSGCWRYHPDDLAESMDVPDGTDPGTVLAQGMTAIVSQGASANERLLAMTEIATDGLKDATSVLSAELKRAYAKIAELEEKLAAMRDKLSTDRGMELQHERRMRVLDQKHELAIVGGKETSERLQGLLSILGPIAASIGHRLLGRLAHAEAAEASAAGLTPSESSSPMNPSQSPSTSPSTVSIETRITQGMARLCDIIHRLDGPAYEGFRAMLPISVAEALDAVKKGENDQVVGRALAVLVKAAQNLSDLQFRALKPIAPADIASVLSELREILRNDSSQPESTPT